MKTLCEYKKQNLDHPENKDIYYILAILENRRIITNKKQSFLRVSKLIHKFEYDTYEYKKYVENLKCIASECESYDEFFKNSQSGQ